ncbi:conserved Plasmodium protein, unknown function [Plasmodium gaboni]|uniref:Uncharacterized protein n=1 Tax=Plasmodium gaboni TaxID=647221 RepID=A0ABY1USN9_9APIC|nr:conserved Plasmodium protein, unknown function [Plasmodium gaboni]
MKNLKLYRCKILTDIYVQKKELEEYLNILYYLDHSNKDFIENLKIFIFDEFYNIQDDNENEGEEINSNDNCVNDKEVEIYSTTEEKILLNNKILEYKKSFENKMIYNKVNNEMRYYEIFIFYNNKFHDDIIYNSIGLEICECAYNMNIMEHSKEILILSSHEDYKNLEDIKSVDNEKFTNDEKFMNNMYMIDDKKAQNNMNIYYPYNNKTEHKKIKKILMSLQINDINNFSGTLLKFPLRINVGKMHMCDKIIMATIDCMLFMNNIKNIDIEMNDSSIYNFEKTKKFINISPSFYSEEENIDLYKDISYISVEYTHEELCTEYILYNKNLNNNNNKNDNDFYKNNEIIFIYTTSDMYEIQKYYDKKKENIEFISLFNNNIFFIKCMDTLPIYIKSYDSNKIDNIKNNLFCSNDISELICNEYIVFLMLLRELNKFNSAYDYFSYFPPLYILEPSKFDIISYLLYEKLFDEKKRLKLFFNKYNMQWLDFNECLFLSSELKYLIDDNTLYDIIKYSDVKNIFYFDDKLKHALYYYLNDLCKEKKNYERIIKIVSNSLIYIDDIPDNLVSICKNVNEEEKLRGNITKKATSNNSNNNNNNNINNSSYNTFISTNDNNDNCVSGRSLKNENRFFLDIIVDNLKYMKYEKCLNILCHMLQLNDECIDNCLRNYYCIPNEMKKLKKIDELIYPIDEVYYYKFNQEKYSINIEENKMNDNFKYEKKQMIDYIDKENLISLDFMNLIGKQKLNNLKVWGLKIIEEDYKFNDNINDILYDLNKLYFSTNIYENKLKILNKIISRIEKNIHYLKDSYILEKLKDTFFLPVYRNKTMNIDSQVNKKTIKDNVTNMIGCEQSLCDDKMIIQIDSYHIINDDIKNNDLVNGNNIVNDDITKDDDIKNNDIANDDVTNDDIKNNDISNDDVTNGNITNGDIKKNNILNNDTNNYNGNNDIYEDSEYNYSHNNNNNIKNLVQISPTFSNKSIINNNSNNNIRKYYIESSSLLNNKNKKNGYNNFIKIADSYDKKYYNLLFLIKICYSTENIIMSSELCELLDIYKKPSIKDILSHMNLLTRNFKNNYMQNMFKVYDFIYEYFENYIVENILNGNNSTIFKNKKDSPKDNINSYNNNNSHNNNSEGHNTIMSNSSNEIYIEQLHIGEHEKLIHFLQNNNYLYIKNKLWNPKDVYYHLKNISFNIFLCDLPKLYRIKYPNMLKLSGIQSKLFHSKIISILNKIKNKIEMKYKKMVECNKFNKETNKLCKKQLNNSDCNSITHNQYVNEKKDEALLQLTGLLRMSYMNTINLIDISICDNINGTKSMNKDELYYNEENNISSGNKKGNMSIEKRKLTCKCFDNIYLPNNKYILIKKQECVYIKKAISHNNNNKKNNNNNNNNSNNSNYVRNDYNIVHKDIKECIIHLLDITKAQKENKENTESNHIKDSKENINYQPNTKYNINNNNNNNSNNNNNKFINNLNNKKNAKIIKNKIEIFKKNQELSFKKINPYNLKSPIEKIKSEALNKVNPLTYNINKKKNKDTDPSLIGYIEKKKQTSEIKKKKISLPIKKNDKLNLSSIQSCKNDIIKNKNRINHCNGNINNEACSISEKRIRKIIYSNTNISTDKKIEKKRNELNETRLFKDIKNLIYFLDDIGCFDIKFILDKRIFNNTYEDIPKKFLKRSCLHLYIKFKKEIYTNLLINKNEMNKYIDIYNISTMNTYTCDESGISESLKSCNDLICLYLFKHFSYILDYLLLLNGNNISEWYKLKKEEYKNDNLKENHSIYISKENDINQEDVQINSNHYTSNEDNQTYKQVDKKYTYQNMDSKKQDCEEKYIIYKRKNVSLNEKDKILMKNILLYDRFDNIGRVKKSTFNLSYIKKKKNNILVKERNRNIEKRKEVIKMKILDDNIIEMNQSPNIKENEKMNESENMNSNDEEIYDISNLEKKKINEEKEEEEENNGEKIICIRMYNKNKIPLLKIVEKAFLECKKFNENFLIFSKNIIKIDFIKIFEKDERAEIITNLGISMSENHFYLRQKFYNSIKNLYPNNLNNIGDKINIYNDNINNNNIINSNSSNNINENYNNHTINSKEQKLEIFLQCQIYNGNKSSRWIIGLLENTCISICFEHYQIFRKYYLFHNLNIISNIESLPMHIKINVLNNTFSNLKKTFRDDENVSCIVKNVSILYIHFLKLAYRNTVKKILKHDTSKILYKHKDKWIKKKKKINLNKNNNNNELSTISECIEYKNCSYNNNNNENDIQKNNYIYKVDKCDIKEFNEIYQIIKNKYLNFTPKKYDKNDLFNNVVKNVVLNCYELQILPCLQKKDTLYALYWDNIYDCINIYPFCKYVNHITFFLLDLGLKVLLPYYEIDNLIHIHKLVRSSLNETIHLNKKNLEDTKNEMNCDTKNGYTFSKNIYNNNNNSIPLCSSIDMLNNENVIRNVSNITPSYLRNKIKSHISIYVCFVKECLNEMRGSSVMYLFDYLFSDIKKNDSNDTIKKYIKSIPIFAILSCDILYMKGKIQTYRYDKLGRIKEDKHIENMFEDNENKYEGNKNKYNKTADQKIDEMDYYNGYTIYTNNNNNNNNSNNNNSSSNNSNNSSNNNIDINNINIINNNDNLINVKREVNISRGTYNSHIIIHSNDIKTYNDDNKNSLNNFFDPKNNRDISLLCDDFVKIKLNHFDTENFLNFDNIHLIKYDEDQKIYCSKYFYMFDLSKVMFINTHLYSSGILSLLIETECILKLTFKNLIDILEYNLYPNIFHFCSTYKMKNKENMNKMNDIIKKTNDTFLNNYDYSNITKDVVVKHMDTLNINNSCDYNNKIEQGIEYFKIYSIYDNYMKIPYDINIIIYNRLLLDMVNDIYKEYSDMNFLENLKDFRLLITYDTLNNNRNTTYMYIHNINDIKDIINVNFIDPNVEQVLYSIGYRKIHNSLSNDSIFNQYLLNDYEDILLSLYRNMSCINWSDLNNTQIHTLLSAFLSNIKFNSNNISYLKPLPIFYSLIDSQFVNIISKNKKYIVIGTNYENLLLSIINEIFQKENNYNEDIMLSQGDNTTQRIKENYINKYYINNSTSTDKSVQDSNKIPTVLDNMNIGNQNIDEINTTGNNMNDDNFNYNIILSSIPKNEKTNSYILNSNEEINSTLIDNSYNIISNIMNSNSNNDNIYNIITSNTVENKLNLKYIFLHHSNINMDYWKYINIKYWYDYDIILYFFLNILKNCNSVHLFENILLFIYKEYERVYKKRFVENNTSSNQLNNMNDTNNIKNTIHSDISYRDFLINIISELKEIPLKFKANLKCSQLYNLNNDVYREFIYINKLYNFSKLQNFPYEQKFLESLNFHYIPNIMEINNFLLILINMLKQKGNNVIDKSAMEMIFNNINLDFSRYDTNYEEEHLNKKISVLLKYINENLKHLLSQKDENFTYLVNSLIGLLMHDQKFAEKIKTYDILFMYYTQKDKEIADIMNNTIKSKEINETTNEGDKNFINIKSE